MEPSAAESLREPVAVAFARALRHLGVRNSQRFVARRLAAHPDAASLFAMIDLAPSFGVNAEAYQCDLEALEPEDLPAVLYWKAGAQGREGFGALLAIEDNRYVFAGPGGEIVQLRRPEVERDWSGIAVAVSRSGAPARDAGYVFWSAGERLREGIGRILRDWGHGGVLRAGAASLVAILTVVAVLRAEGSRAGALGLTLLLGLALAGSFVLDRMSRPGREAGRARLAARLCGAGGFVDCDSVLHSRWAGFRKWSLASVGLGWFLSCFLLIATAGMLESPAGGVFHWLAAVSLALLPFSLLLIVVQIWPLRKICLFCMLVHAAVLGCAAIAWFAFLPARAGLADATLLIRYGPAHGLFFLAVLGIFLPWRVSRWRELSADRTRGMATPLASLALTSARDVVEIGPESVPLAWGSPRAPLPVDVCISPLCDACPQVVEELRGLIEKHPSALFIRFHIVPKSSSRDPSDLRLSIALTALGLLAGEKIALEAFLEVKRNQGPGRWQDQAVQRVEELVARYGEAGAASEALGRAEEMTRIAAEATRQAAVGVPAVFLAGRYFDAPLDHLDHLLARNPDLLVACLAAR